jgi:hypothetical protein
MNIFQSSTHHSDTTSLINARHHSLIIQQHAFSTGCYGGASRDSGESLMLSVSNKVAPSTAINELDSESPLGETSI